MKHPSAPRAWALLLSGVCIAAIAGCGGAGATDDTAPDTGLSPNVVAIVGREARTTPWLSQGEGASLTGHFETLHRGPDTGAEGRFWIADTIGGVQCWHAVTVFVPDDCRIVIGTSAPAPFGKIKSAIKQLTLRADADILRLKLKISAGRAIATVIEVAQ